MIKDLKDGYSAKGYYIVKNVIKGVTNNGLSYMTVFLQDKSGIIESKKWDYDDEDLEVFKAGNIVYVDGDTIEYKDKLQIKIYSGNLIDVNSIDLTDLIPASELSGSELKNKLNSILATLKNESIKKIVLEIFKQYKDRFLTYPAAMSNHHDYLRGLMEHTVSMCEIAQSLCSHYKSLNYDLLLAGCLLHDIGKCEELSGVIGTTYTKEGSLVGHLVIGAMLVDEAAKKLNIDGEEVLLLKHLILSHHGKLEFGSPIPPLTREALILSFIDEIDAKMKALDKAFSEIEGGEFTNKLFALDGRMFYKLKSEKEEK